MRPARATPSGRRRARSAGEILGAPGREPRARAGADPLRAHAGLAVRVLPRRGRGDGRRPRRHAARPGFSVQLCGDAHLSNFGVFASPERRLVFDINDFDETLPGPWEWDVKRLAASFAVAGRERGFAQARAAPASLPDRRPRYRRGDARVRGDAQPRRLVRAARRRAGSSPRSRLAASTSAQRQAVERSLAKARAQGQPAGPREADPRASTASCGSSATRR